MNHTHRYPVKKTEIRRCFLRYTVVSLLRIWPLDSRYAVVSPNARRRMFKRILETRYAYILPRYARRKSPTPSYLRGASVDLRLEYVNEQDMPIHELRFSGVKINHQKDGAANVKYGRRNSRRISRRLRRLHKPIQNGAGRRFRSHQKH